jgi:SAM-dependent methyltransferase
MSVGYALAYRLGDTPWERAGSAARESLEALFAREEADRGRPPGRALDLGCGQGTHTAQLAERGWDAVGVDDVERALDTARERATSTGAEVRFVRADVTRLEDAGLGTFDFFLDIGCFHGLDAQGRSAEARGVTELARPDATLLLMAFRPHRLPLLPSGVERADVERAFTGWEIVSVEAADTSGMPGPLKRTAPQFYRLRLR